MSGTVDTATIAILNGLQGSIAQRRTVTLARFDLPEAQVGRLDTGLRKDRRNAAGLSVLVRETAGARDARVTALKARASQNTAPEPCLPTF